MHNSTVLTVVICTHNRADLLKKCLNALNYAEKPYAFEVEILVIANSCNDNTAFILEE